MNMEEKYCKDCDCELQDLALECDRCGEIICSDCYYDWSGCCEECREILNRENEDIKNEQWNTFFDSIL